MSLRTSGRIMNWIGREQVRTHIQKIAEGAGYNLVRVLVFGSRARGDHPADSDVDVILASPDFEGMPFYRQSGPFYRGVELRGTAEPRVRSADACGVRRVGDGRESDSGTGGGRRRGRSEIVASIRRKCCDSELKK